MTMEAPKERAAIDEALATYQPGTWFDATSVDLMQAFFESRLPAIREAAREHGYAIGLHGSMRRDLDLIAAPWRDGVSDRDTLAHAIAMAACGITRAGAYEWEQKPAGRAATCLPICWTHRHGVLSDGHIDLSVCPSAHRVEDLERDAERLRRTISVLWMLHRGEIAAPPNLNQYTEEVLHASRTIWKN